MEKYINKKLYCKQVLGVLCDEAIQVPINSICVVSTNFNDAIPLRRFDTRWNSSKLNEYQRSFCLSSRVAASLFRAEKSTFDDKHGIVILFGPISPTPMSKKVSSVQGCSAFLCPNPKPRPSNSELLKLWQTCDFSFCFGTSCKFLDFLRNDPKTKRICNRDFEPIFGEMVCNLHFSHVEPSKTAPRNSMR